MAPSQTNIFTLKSSTSQTFFLRLCARVLKSSIFKTFNLRHFTPSPAYHLLTPVSLHCDDVQLALALKIEAGKKQRQLAPGPSDTFRLALAAGVTIASAGTHISDGGLA